MLNRKFINTFDNRKIKLLEKRLAIVIRKLKKIKFAYEKNDPFICGFLRAAERTIHKSKQWY